VGTGLQSSIPLETDKSTYFLIIGAGFSGLVIAE
jgi:cation diffusion facilitator CzcD-associated flavoprotein CzcO